MREAGVVIVSDVDSDKVIQSPTMQCVHCGRHWVVQPGSGRKRGTCLRCNGPICGPCCAVCVPTEQRLKNLAEGRPEDYRPILVPVGVEL